jgi:hypothetical protein
MNVYRGWTISYQKRYSPGPQYTAAKRGEVLQATSRVGIERAIDTREKQIALENKSLENGQKEFDNL